MESREHIDRLVLYDGVCGFCQRSVQWILRVDDERKFQFAPLDGSTAHPIRARHPEIPQGIDSILLVETRGGVEHVYWRSEAVFRIAAALPRKWRALSWFSILPRFLSDLGYRIFAALRYPIFGKVDQCPIPSPANRARFLP